MEQLEAVVSQGFRLSSFQTGRQLFTMESTGVMLYSQGRMICLAPSSTGQGELEEIDLGRWSRAVHHDTSLDEEYTVLARIPWEFDLQSIVDIDIKERAMFIVNQVE